MSPMKFAQVNINRGFQYKVEETANWANKEKIDVVAVSESGLCPEDCTRDHFCAKVPELDGWTWVGKPRNIHGGGVGFLLRDNVAFKVRQDLSDRAVEQIWIEIFRDRLPSVLACSVYIPPGKIEQLSRFTDIVTKARHVNRLILIMGDFNARSTVLGDTKDNDLADAILALLAMENLTLVNVRGVATRFSRICQSVLDLTLTSRALAPLVKSWKVSSNLPTDHFEVTFSIGHGTGKRVKEVPRIAWDLKRCDWDKFRVETERALSSWLAVAESDPDRPLDELYKGWVDVLLGVVDQIVPLRKLTSRSRAFWSPEIEKLVVARRKYLHLYRNYPTKGSYERYQRAHKASRAAIKASKDRLKEEQAEFVASATKEDIYRRYRRANRAPKKHIPVLVVGDRLLYDRAPQVQALNAHFSSAGADKPGVRFDADFKRYVESVVESFDIAAEVADDEGSSSPITLQEVRTAIARLGSFKTPGPDKVHPMFLKKGGSAVIHSLTYIFNRSFESGCLPYLWRLAHITPIPKRLESIINAFRPISILSIPGKLLDRIVANRVTFLSEVNCWLKPFQGGFRKGRSTVDQLLDFRERVTIASLEGKVCVTAFLDISAAYDGLWKQGLMYKLIKVGLRGRLLAWVHGFLSERFGAVCVAGVRSETKSYQFGLPQGSCLSPILFNIFMADMLPSNFINPSRGVGIFADDVRVSTYNKNVVRASSALSRELQSVSSFGERWRINFDVLSKKCGTMTFSLSKVALREVVFFGRTILNRFDEYKYLGVIFDPNMSFESHVEKVRLRAWGAYHQLRSLTTRFWGVSTKIMVRLYQAYVTPCLEYACQVWATANQSVLKRLEPIQTAALRTATGALWSTSQDALQVYCGVWPLVVRREFLSSSQLCRIRALPRDSHPIAETLHAWNSCRSRRKFMAKYTGYFGMTTSLLRLYRRFHQFSDGGADYVERVEPILRAPWRETKEVEALPSKQVAAQEHRKFTSTLTDDVLCVYTDGSATPNPGRAGAGAVVCSKECTFLLSESVGIATSLTAELFAIRMSLRFLLARPHTLQDISSILFFVDSIVASRFSTMQWVPTSNFLLCKEVHDSCKRLLDTRIPVQFRWVPSHVGVEQNEMADRLAERGAAQLGDTTSPIEDQPPVPHTVAKGMIRSAIWNQQIGKWMNVMAQRLGCDHLSRIQLGARPVKLFYVGARRTQTTLARLRFGHVNLNAHMFRFNAADSPCCACGEGHETVSHFLLYCPLFKIQRQRMMQSVRTVLPVGTDPTEQILLGGADFEWGTRKYQKVAKAVCEFVEQTGRF